MRSIVVTTSSLMLPDCFMSSIWPSSISDCNLSPPPLDFDVMDKKLLFYFIFSSGLFGSCMPAINSC